jgi:hypothetical protein
MWCAYLIVLEDIVFILRLNRVTEKDVTEWIIPFERKISFD